MGICYFIHIRVKNIENSNDQEQVSTNYLSSFNFLVIVLENSVLEIIVDTVNGNILSSRLKDYPVVSGAGGG